MRISALKTHMQMLSLLDTNGCFYWYLLPELEQWPGWPAGDQHHRVRVNYIQDSMSLRYDELGYSPPSVHQCFPGV